MNENDFCCVIHDLKKKSFESRSFNDKKKIIKEGRPTPALGLINKTYNRRFAVRQYLATTWLAGCSSSVSLYCWPCILFSKENNVWTSNVGFKDLNHLRTTIKRHEFSSPSHLKSVLKLQHFDKESKIKHVISSEGILSANNHNMMVQKNRTILKELIKCTVYLGVHDLSIWVDDKSSSSPDNYIGLLNMLAENSCALSNYLENGATFADTPATVQNVLIKCISSVIFKHIFTDIGKSKYFALLLNEFTDINNKAQLSTVFRYVDERGKVQERFVGFTDLSANRTADGLLKHVLQIINKYECDEKKLICQMYADAAVLGSEITNLREKMKQHYPNTLYVHCFAHKFNLVLSKSCSRIIKCNKFFKILSSLVNFFSRSTKRSVALDEIVQKLLPGADPTTWEYNSCIVMTVNQNLDSLLQFFEEIINSEDTTWDGEDFISATGLLAYLKSIEFVFLLFTFSEIFPHSDILSNILQTEQNNISFCIEKVNGFKELMVIFRNSKFVEIFEISLNFCQKNNINLSILTRSDKKMPHVIDTFMQLFNEIIDNIISETSSRFSLLKNLSFLELLNTSRFNEYNIDFPNSMFSNLESEFPNKFDFVLLKTELKVIFANEDCKNKNISHLILYLTEFELECHFREFFKLCSFILTIPASNVEVERTPALKRVKTYLGNSNRVHSNLSVISIEKDIICKLKCANKFYDEVINKFSKKKPQIELIYKE